MSTEPKHGHADFTPYLQETYARPIDSMPLTMEISKLKGRISELESTIANSDAAMANALERLESEKNRLIMERDQRIEQLKAALRKVVEVAATNEEYKDKEIAELRGHMRDTIAPALDQIRTADYVKRIEQLESLLSDTMKTMKLYINVPEFDDLQQRWEALKST